MAFAIFYNVADLTVVGQGLAVTNISGPDKTLARNYWNGGIKDWTAAPIAQSPYEQVIPTNTARRVVCTFGTLAEFRALLLRVVEANPSLSYLKALVDDMGRNCGGIEGWI